MAVTETDRSSGDRGQLLLVGGIAVAVTILSIALVLAPEATTADTVMVDSQPATIDDAERYERVVMDDLQRLVNETATVDALRANVTRYDDQLAAMAAQAGPAAVGVRFLGSTPDGYAFQFTYVSPRFSYRTRIEIASP